MRGLGLGQESILEEGCLWLAPHMAKGVGDGDPATLSLLLWLCLEERTPSSGLNWQQKKQTFLLPSADHQYPLPLSLHGLCLCLSLDMFSGSAQVPIHTLVSWYQDHLPSSSTHWFLSVSTSVPRLWPSLWCLACLSSHFSVSPQDPRRKNQTTFPRTEVKDIFPATPDAAPGRKHLKCEDLRGPHLGVG